MNEPKKHQSFYYKVAALERAIVQVRIKVSQFNDHNPLYLSPIEYAVLLEAARLGLKEIYTDHSILERMTNWPLP